MDIREQAIESVKNTNIDKLGGSLFRKVKLFAWETGLGPLINVKPEIFGQQAVLYFDPEPRCGAVDEAGMVCWNGKAAFSRRKGRGDGKRH